MNVDGLLPHQQSSARQLMDVLARRGAALDASDMGSGKTYVACSLVRETRLPTLVIAPKTILTAWHRVAAYMGTDLDTINWEKVRTGRTPYGRWEDPTCKKFVWDKRIGMLIFDEAHRGKGTNTLNSYIMAGAKGRTTMCLTGTPATSPLEMKSLGYLLGLHDYKQFWKWTRHFGCGPCHWGGFEFKGSFEEKREHMARLHRLIFPERGVRVRWQDIPGFPDAVLQPGLYDATTKSEVDEAYHQIAQAKLGDVREVTHAFMRVEQIKRPIMLDLADDALDQGYSVALFCNFRETIAKLAEAFEDNRVPYGIVQGDQTEEERQAAIDGFQEHRLPVILVNNAAGGVGLSLHDTSGQHPRLQIVSPSLSPSTFKQVAFRTRRVGGGKVLVKFVYIAGTVEEQTKINVEAKLDCLDTLNDGDLNPVLEDA